MQNFGIVQQGSTVRIMFVTRDGSGGAVAPSSAFGNEDIEIYKDGGATQRASDAGITMTSPFDTVTGLHLLAIDLSDNTDPGFYSAGSTYHVTIQPDETVDSQTVVEVLAMFHIESDSQKAQRTLGEKAYVTEVLATQTGVSDGTKLNLSAQIDAQVPNDVLIGTVWLVRDETDGRAEEVVVTDYAATGTLATVARLGDGGALSFTPVAGDQAWRVGVVDRTYTASAADLAIVDANVDTIVSPYITGTVGATSLGATSCSSDLTAYADSELVGRTIVFTGGTAAGQAGRIVSYTATNGVVGFTTITTAPLENDTFVIV